MGGQKWHPVRNELESRLENWVSIFLSQVFWLFFTLSGIFRNSDFYELRLPGTALDLGSFF